MRRVHFIAGAVLLLVIALAGGWYALSPGWTVKAMVDAARAGDEAGFSAHVDYPALRADMKTEVTKTLEAQANRDPTPRGKMGLAVGMALMGPMVDRLVSPDALRTAFAKLADAQSESGASNSGKAGKAAEMPQIRRDGFNRFLVSPENLPDSGLVFERRGLGWKLTGIELPSEAGPAKHR